jgi:excinuclease UvrABC ATPase subunit
MTPFERQGQPDCLVEIGLDWLQRPLGGLTETERAVAIEEVCQVISQMRHRDQKFMDVERRRWLERVTVRLCQQCGGMRGYESAVQVQLERRMTAAMLQYRNWREKMAPKFGQSIATGSSDGGEVAA